MTGTECKNSTPSYYHHKRRQGHQVVSESDSQSSSSRFESPLWPLARFFLGGPELKSLANWLPPARLGFLILLYVVFELFVSKYLSRVPVN